MTQTLTVPVKTVHEIATWLLAAVTEPDVFPLYVDTSKGPRTVIADAPIV
jgi:hypothetical protein